MKLFYYIKYLKNYKRALLRLTVLSILLMLLLIVKPYLMSNLFDLLIQKQQETKVINRIILIIIVGLIQIIAGYFKNISNIKLTANFMFDMLSDVIEHLKLVNYIEISKIDTGYLSNRSIEDTTNISEFVIESLFNFIINLITIIISFALIFKSNHTLAISILPIFLIYCVIYILYKGKLYTNNYAYTEKQSEFFSKLNFQLKNFKLIKTNSWYTESKTELNSSFISLFNKGLKFAKSSYIYSNIQMVITIVANAFILLYGASLVLSDIITIGNLIYINSLFGIMLSSINYFLSFSQQYQQFLVSNDRINKLFLINKENNGSVNISEINSIELKNLSFFYEKDRLIIKNINCKFEKGKIYGICGKNGSGKSTLFDLLLGIHKKCEGNIFINEVNLDDVNIYHFRKNKICLCQQQPETFCYENEKSSKVFFKNITLLSGGEKQKQVINRCLNKGTDVLLLDEPTSALDSQSVIKLKNILSDFKKNSIIIIITHDNKIMDVCDEIINITI